jgi:ketosteroid isomerase-like protein
MRLLMVIAGMLCLWAGTSRAAGEEDLTGVRKRAEQYIAALLQRDKETLQALIHERYEGRSLPGISRIEKGAKAEAIAHWTDPHTTFMSLASKVESVRIFGDTAIEAGTLSANRKDYGTDSTWADLTYTRVWVKEGKSWRLVHEQY